MASVIADAVDADGRWCFLYVDTIAERSGGTLSPSTVRRGIDDLVRTRLVRRLAPHQASAFFAADIGAGRRWSDRLPLVLELMIPAGAYPGLALEEVNHARARLGEEPLDETTRPYPPVGTTCHPGPGPVHPAPDGQSTRPIDLSPEDPSPSDRSPSVRERAATGGTSAGQSGDGTPGHTGNSLPELLSSRVPDHALRSPRTDRAALCQAARRLLDQGLTPAELLGLFHGATALRRPFPALMHRMRTLTDARSFLDGRLGASAGVGVGVGRTASFPLGSVPSSRAAADDGDPFDRSPEFRLDAAGTASGTCPDHPGIRNVPGGTCRACGSPCRSVPGERLHPPALPPTGPPRPLPVPVQGPVPLPQGLEPAEEPALDTALLARMRASLGRQENHAAPPSCPPGPAPRPGRYGT